MSAKTCLKLRQMWNATSTITSCALTAKQNAFSTKVENATQTESLFWKAKKMAFVEHLSQNDAIFQQKNTK